MIIIINIVIVIIIIVVVRSLSLFLLLNVHLSTFHMFLHDEGFLMRNYYLTLTNQSKCLSLHIHFPTL